MILRAFICCAAVAVALAVAACGSDGIPKEDQDRMQELADLVGVAFSKEDWPAVYVLYPPSIRESCSEADYVTSVTAAADFLKQALGEEEWEKSKKNSADGYDVTSIAVEGDRATAKVKEGEEPLFFRREDGHWWYWEDDPCGFELQGTPVFGPSPTPTKAATPTPQP